MIHLHHQLKFGENKKFSSKENINVLVNYLNKIVFYSCRQLNEEAMKQ